MSHQACTFYPEDDVVFLNVESNGSTALVHLHGATVISWKCQAKENLFLSSSAVFDGKKAIRGGVPIVFPNFGPWSHGPQHGFARIKRWSVIEPPTKKENGSVFTVLSLEDDEETRKMWDFKFKLIYTIELTEDCLIGTLVVKNTDCKSLSFTCLLHTYFRVTDISTTTVSGLEGIVYSDKLQEGREEKESHSLIKLEENYDRVYKDAPQRIGIASGGDPSRKIEMTTSNFPDIVLWNPWEKKAKEMGDFDDLGFKEMICVEPGKVTEPVLLEAGQQFECSHILKSL